MECTRRIFRAQANLAGTDQGKFGTPTEKLGIATPSDIALLRTGSNFRTDPTLTDENFEGSFVVFQHYLAASDGWVLPRLQRHAPEDFDSAPIGLVDQAVQNDPTLFAPHGKVNRHRTLTNAAQPRAKNVICGRKRFKLCSGLQSTTS